MNAASANDSEIPYPDLLGKTVIETMTMVGLASVPIVGSGIQVVVSAYLQRAKEKRWADFWVGVEQSLSELSFKKLDSEYLQSEDFVNRVSAIYNQVIESQDTAKFEYLKGYLLNCLWVEGPDVSWKDLFFQHLRNLTGAHLRCLSYFYDLQGTLSEMDRFNLPQKTDRSPLTCKDIARHLPKGFDLRLIEALISDLSSHGLLRNWHGGELDSAGWSITGTGIHFMKFLSIAE